MIDEDRSLKAGVQLSAEDAADAVRLIKLLTGEPVAGDSGGQHAARQSPRDVAVREQRARRLRSKHFAPALTSGPAYGMLLALYAADSTAGPMSSKQLVHEANVAPTTALRWLDYLVDQGVVDKTASQKDRRLVLVGLTERGKKMLDGYFTEIIQSGLEF